MSGNGHLAGLSGDELRAHVRAVLREVLPTLVADANGAATAPGIVVEPVSLRCDADLDAFVQLIATLCEDPAQRAALRDGRRRFRLTGAPVPEPVAPRVTDPGPASGTAAPVVRIEQGAVTERRVAQAAVEGTRLVLGRRAVLTPLARDKARTLGVVVEKER